jgi:hypothetical protein
MQMGPMPHNCPCQHPYGSHALTTFHVIAMSAKTSIYTSSLLSTSLSSQQPRHPPRHQCMMWQLNLWQKLYYLWRLFLSERTGLGWASGTREHSMTVSKRHGSSNPWRKFKERHEVWSVTLNTWCYLRSS